MNKYVPKYLAQTIYDIDFNKLYAFGKNIILFDLDNTLASYDVIIPTEKQIELNEKLRIMGFKIYIISNNHEGRTKKYTSSFPVDDYLVLANKPFTKKIKKFLKKNEIDSEKSIWIGDQLLTDISCANKLGIDSILVSSISRKSEKWYTKINRVREKFAIKSIAKIDIEKAIEVKKIIGEMVE